MSHAAFIAQTAGRTDAMGLPFSDWLAALLDTTGRAVRDADQRVVYVTQAEWLALQSGPAPKPAKLGQQELFA